MTRPSSSARPVVTRYVPIASYLDDRAIHDRVFALLRARSLDYVAAGSLGITLSVEATQVDEARRVLEAAIASEGLAVTMVRDLPPSEP